MHSPPPHELIVRAIITQNDFILVNQGTRHQSNSLYYALPGGHVEAGENCTEALKRELQEELDIDCRVADLCFVIEHLYPGRRTDDGMRHELTLYFKATPDFPLPQHDEKIDSPEPAKNFRWLPINAISEAALLPQVSREYLQKYFSHQQAPLYAFQNSSSPDAN
jgi:mutator protein MutT